MHVRRRRREMGVTHPSKSGRGFGRVLYQMNAQFAQILCGNVAEYMKTMLDKR